MLPPRPPSPPSGPPLGICFSRRKLADPLPPSPAITSIFASSMNFMLECQLSTRLSGPKRIPSRVNLLLAIQPFVPCAFKYSKVKGPVKRRGLLGIFISATLQRSQRSPLCVFSCPWSQIPPCLLLSQRACDPCQGPRCRRHGTACRADVR